ncbi:serine threonine-protein kinase-like protein [Ophiostoma piceae UAMH 11346]|uniref:Serine threonine-protein kinase-like protein n=1 Tax=Ophiostoma piceae (strain UAMH 11346) TaxID=1262450 RepID=S3CQP0_OPHP1|nr:serine threonine-protein kinase-like protein [Ophiostoma piceae UAMH 11346]
MDGDMSQPTQPATQNVIDPRRIGKQNSGFTDEDIADIICLLIPYSPNARNEAIRLAREGSPYVIGREETRTVDVDYTYEDYAGRFGLSATDPGSGPAFVLRLSAQVKNPLDGFTFGRNANRCDVCFNNDTLRRLSNIHFRIFINEHGVLMLQDQSTNGTVVDEVLLKAKARRPGLSNKRTLNSGTKISILLQNDAHDLIFLVRVPRREGQYEAAYARNLHAYLENLAMRADLDESTTQPTIGAGPAGIVNLFPAPPAQTTAGRIAAAPAPVARRPPPRFDALPTEGLPREWNGSTNYNRVRQIGKGAFATVHMVTSKYDGKPYAAKELDKRRFVKNGVLDQKVENEMKIMQNIEHPNVVRYIEHFDFDDRLLIIIMEFVQNGDLGSLITKHGCLPEATVREMAMQLIDALGYLHRKNITHRDVKPDNILIESFSPFVVKLTDFGLSKMVDNEETFLQTFCGTLLYCAPEVYGEYAEYDENGVRSNRPRKKPRIPGQRYDHAVDIWSLGGVLFYCLTGRPPFPVKQGTTYMELLNWIMTLPLNVEPLHAANVSTDCVHFLTLMLQNRAERRATVETLQKHPWITGPESSSADDLEQSASQLKLVDSDLPDTRLDSFESDDEILDDIVEEMIGNTSQVNEILPGLGGAPTPQSDDAYDDYDDADQPLEDSPTIRRPLAQHPRLFGEVNVSAIGSSGVIPAERLNLPLSDLGQSTDNTASEYEEFEDISESGETFLTPRIQQQQQQQQQHAGQQWSQPRSQRELATDRGTGPGGSGTGPNIVTNVPAPLSQSHNLDVSRSVGELNNMTFDVASQSLGGAESILEHLNMKSVAPQFKHSVTDFASSKRKPAPDTSDEFESAPVNEKPTIKRLKSDVHMDSAFEGQEGSSSAMAQPETSVEVEVYSAVKPVSHSKSGRQMDLPVSKSVYWTAGDLSSYHLEYPEMTQLQYNAFDDAASARGEKFRPGRSLLWELAKRHFPPTTPSVTRYESSEPRSRSRSVSHAPDTVTNISEDDQKENVMPDTATPGSYEPSSSPMPVMPPSQQPGHAQIVVPIVSMQDCVARLDSVPGSILRNISVPIRDSITTWGRHPKNTQVFLDKQEQKVPKYAFNILLWRDDADGGAGSEPWEDRNLWSRYNPVGEAASRYHFYISTKARYGILINGVQLSSHEPNNPKGAARYWTRLYDGDLVAVWYRSSTLEHQTRYGTAASDGGVRVELVFRCTWGGSARPRPAHVAVGLADEMTRRRLDEACIKAQEYVAHNKELDQRYEDARRDVAERTARIDQERQRSIDFESVRAEVLESAGVSQQQRRPLLPSQPASAPTVLMTVAANGNITHGSNNNMSDKNYTTPTQSAVAMGPTSQSQSQETPRANAVRQ